MIVLVVENDPVNGAVVTNLLRKNGMTAEWATDYQSAVTKLVASTPDVMVLDVDLGPGESGLELIRDSVAAGRRVVVMTAAGDTAVSAIKETYPQVVVLRKPVEVADIVKAVGGLTRPEDPGK